MSRKQGRQGKWGTDSSHPPTTPPQARIRAASPRGTPVPQRTKSVTCVTGDGWETVEEVEVPKRQDKIDKQWMELLAKETEKSEVA